MQPRLLNTKVFFGRPLSFGAGHHRGVLMVPLSAPTLTHAMSPNATLSSALLKPAFWSAAVLIGVLSLMPTAFLPPQAFDVWDKAQHAGAFAVLALLGSSAYPGRFWTVCLGLLAYGGAIELAQSATGWRYGDWQDGLADAVGIALGSAVALGARRFRRRQ